MFEWDLPPTGTTKFGIKSSIPYSTTLASESAILLGSASEKHTCRHGYEEKKVLIPSQSADLRCHTRRHHTELRFGLRHSRKYSRLKQLLRRFSVRGWYFPGQAGSFMLKVDIPAWLYHNKILLYCIRVGTSGPKQTDLIGHKRWDPLHHLTRL